MMIQAEIRKIDKLLDQEIQDVEAFFRNKRHSDYSLINNSLLHIYNEMLTLSYSIKLWLISELILVSEAPEEMLKTVKGQFKAITGLLKNEKLFSDWPSMITNKIQSYQKMTQAI